MTAANENGAVQRAIFKNPAEREYFLRPMTDEMRSLSRLKTIETQLHGINAVLRSARGRAADIGHYDPALASLQASAEALVMQISSLRAAISARFPDTATKRSSS